MKNILSIDTTSKITTVSIINEEYIIKSKFKDNKKSHSENILPLIDETLSSINKKLEDIDVFGVCVGPGSFTGIRIGIATVIGLNEIDKKPIIPIYNLELLAYPFKEEEYFIISIIDAQRDLLYINGFNSEENFFNSTSDDFVIKIDEMNNYIKEKNKRNLKVLFVGDGVKKLKEAIDAKNLELENIYKFADEHYNKINGEFLSKLAYEKYESNKILNDSSLLKAHYLRKSQAERQLEK